MFQRIQNCEYPFDYLLSINDGKCRYCDFNGGTIKTNPDVNRLQNHYMEEHPVTQHEGHWTQKISDQEGEKTIAIFGLDTCNQDDCGSMRKERKHYNSNSNQPFTPKMKICLVKTHATFYPNELNEQDTVDYQIFVCIDHFNGTVEQMTDLYLNYGIMYMFRMGMDHPRMRYVGLPTALRNSIAARRICPKFTTINTTCGNLPTAAERVTVYVTLTARIRQLEKKNKTLKTINMELQQAANNNIKIEPDDTVQYIQDEEHEQEQEQEQESEQEELEANADTKIKNSFDNLMTKMNSDLPMNLSQNKRKKSRAYLTALENDPEKTNSGASTSAMANQTSMLPPNKKIKLDQKIQSTNVTNVTKKPYKRRQLTQNEQTFQCNSCPKAFGHKQSLVRHEKIHLNPENA